MNNPSNLLDNHLKLLDEMTPHVTDDFFYTRLKARMLREEDSELFLFNLRPAKLIGVLFLLLIINFSIVLKQMNYNSSNTINDFAGNYGLIIDSPY